MAVSLGTQTARSLTLATLAIGITYSCVETPQTDDEPPDPARGRFLKNAAHCVSSSSFEFADSGDALVAAVEDWSASPDDAAALEGARAAWREAIGLWQILEPMQFGPAGKSGRVDAGGTVGGQDLRDYIYSFPIINSCTVDKGLVDEVWTDDLSSALVNARGLDALEYLLFKEDSESACDPASSIVSEGSWDSIEDLLARRSAYALAVAEQVSSYARQLHDAWFGGFADEFVDAGSSGPYEDQKAAIDAVVTALLYMDWVAKDSKLGVPLGIHDNCSRTTCPDAFEHPTARRNKQSLDENLEGFRKLFEGCADGPGLGLAQLLEEEGAALLVEDIEKAERAVDEALSAIEEPTFNDALTEDPESLRALYDALKELTSLIKLDLIQVLGVNLPAGAGGDND